MISRIEDKIKEHRRMRLDMEVGDDDETMTLQTFNSLADTLLAQDPIRYVALYKKMTVSVIKTLLVNGVDYGIVDGCGEKPMLFRSGAETLLRVFNLSAEFTRTGCTEDWDKGFFAFTYQCTIRDRRGRVITQCEGLCSSKEKKYALRWVPERFATDEQRQLQTARKENRKYRGNYDILVPNPDISDLANTIMKMAQKRALVGAAKLATMTSAFFGNLEDTQRDYEVGDHPTWSVLDAEIINPPKDAEVINPPKRDWKAICHGLGITIANLKAIAQGNGFPSKGDALTSEQSDRLFVLLLQSKAEPGLFRAEQHQRNSLRKVLEDNASDMDACAAWLKKLEEKRNEKTV